MPYHPLPDVLHTHGTADRFRETDHLLPKATPRNGKSELASDSRQRESRSLHRVTPTAPIKLRQVYL